jgi:hypothetical protein
VRDWTAIDIDAQTPCRLCGSQGQTERAHTAGRKHDERTGKGRWKVHPLDIVPLCRPCHTAYDAGRVDLLPYIDVDEQVRVVQHLGGIESARMRLAPLAYRKAAA